MTFRQFFTVVFVALLAHRSIAAELSTPQSIILASTTSVENSGLLAFGHGSKMKYQQKHGDQWAKIAKFEI